MHWMEFILAVYYILVSGRPRDGNDRFSPVDGKLPDTKGSPQVHDRGNRVRHNAADDEGILVRNIDPEGEGGFRREWC